MKSPIFLFSLPRSGSTLLQRVLMSHKDIASVAEPWLMLPFCYFYKKEGIVSEYSHVVAYDAFEDFIRNLPNGENDYYKALEQFAKTLYQNHCLNNEMYFLDKTPRYYNIIPEIAKIFPNAKFIFLFRNPIHIFASMINTWCNGRFKCLYSYHRDLNDGVRLISEGYELLKNKAYALQYEKFVINPKKYIKEISKYLEIDFDDNMLVNFSKQNTKGRMGDPTGVKKYKSINSYTLNKWKKTFNTSFKKSYLIKYIESLDETILNIQGYDKKVLLEEIKNLKVKHCICIRDRLDVLYANLIRIIKPTIWFGKRGRKWSWNKFLS